MKKKITKKQKKTPTEHPKSKKNHQTITPKLNKKAEINPSRTRHLPKISSPPKKWKHARKWMNKWIKKWTRWCKSVLIKWDRIEKTVRQGLVIADPIAGYYYGMNDLLLFFPDLKFCSFLIFRKHFGYFMYKSSHFNLLSFLD